MAKKGKMALSEKAIKEIEEESTGKFKMHLIFGLIFFVITVFAADGLTKLTGIGLMMSFWTLAILDHQDVRYTQLKGIILNSAKYRAVKRKLDEEK